jgi:signal transduction histidine kinase
MKPENMAIHDIKETIKRTGRFAYIALFFAVLTAIANLIYGNELSALILGAYIICVLTTLFLNYKAYFIPAKLFTILSTNAFLTVIVFAEGLRTGGYFFFVPLLSVLPYLIDNHKKYTEELLIYLAISILCFLTCVFFCPQESNWQNISDETYDKMFRNNCISVILIAGSFSMMGLFMERKYIKAIVKQKKKTEEAAQAKAKFLSNMGHELRTPLNGIIGASNILSKENFLPEQREYLNILKYCSDHMLGLVNDILDYNKIEAGQLELHPIEFNLKTALEKSMIPFHNRFKEKGIALKIAIDEKLNAEVKADDIRLVQIVNNILSNAFKFTETGFVKLEANVIDEKDDRVKVSFVVTDTGIGISLQDQFRIFDSFWQVYDESTRKFGGTGLGLTISQKLLLMMGSMLKVQSAEGKGSKFYFDIEFPLIRKAEVKEVVVEDVNDLTDHRILIAEDNMINMMIAKKMLQDWNATVTEAVNGAEALKILQSDKHFNLILLDLEMPEVDGYTAMKEIKRLYPNIPAIAFTAALIDNDMLQNLFDIGFTDCVLKPFKPQELLSKIRKHAVQVEATALA